MNELSVGRRVEVQIQIRDEAPHWSGRGVVTAIYPALDVGYRIDVQSDRPGYAWIGCDPACVRPAA
jgi:hypothetical protein